MTTWKSVYDANGMCWEIYAVGDGISNRLCVLTGDAFAPYPDVHKNARNAALIAAAPDLLAALQSLVTPDGYTVAVSKSDVRAIAANAAIAKAKGEKNGNT